MVQFKDGSVKAQMGLPDMKLPIQYALAYPERLQNNYKRFDFTAYPNLSFEKADTKTFRNLGLAYEALDKGGNMPCIINAANEVAVAGFLADQTGFLEISDIIEACMKHITHLNSPTLDDYLNTDRETRIFAQNIIQHSTVKGAAI
jgi:1-deoxy-D-xylulose-5-phosphate reductoisomerase